MKLNVGLFIFSWIFLSSFSHAQCDVNITNDTLWVCQGNSITLEAVGDCDSIIVQEDFNNNTTGTGLYAEPGLMIDWSNPCTVSLPATGSVATICAGATRAVNTIPFSSNVCDTITVQWDMKYGTNDGSGCCEAPDSTFEGVHLQVLTPYPSGIPNWVDLEYYPSNLTQSGPHYSWNTYEVKIPDLSSIPNVQPITQLRWAQLDHTGPDWDHWMIDNVKISHKCDTALQMKWYTDGIYAGTSPDLTLSPGANTQVVVELSNGNISVFDTVTVLVYPCTGIAESANSHIEIFPNPAGDLLTIQWDKHPIEELRIYSLTGREVMHKPISTNHERYSLDIASLPAGLYVLQVRSGDETGYRQLVIQ